MDNVYEKLLEMGYTLSPDGKLFFNGEEIKPYIKTKNGKQSYIFTKTIDGKRNYIYLSKFQAYIKFGEKALEDKTIFLDGDGSNLSIDNIELQSNNVARRLEAATKVCAKCGRELPVEEFVWKNKEKGIRAPRCKECDRESKRISYRKYFDENKDLFRTRSKIYRKDRLEYINSLKSGGCVCCGETDVDCLDFHHINPKLKEFEIASATDFSKDKIKAEADKCVVLCANCHRKLHKKYNNNLEELLANESPSKE